MYKEKISVYCIEKKLVEYRGGYSSVQREDISVLYCIEKKLIEYRGG